MHILRQLYGSQKNVLITSLREKEHKQNTFFGGCALQMSSIARLGQAGRKGRTKFGFPTQFLEQQHGFPGAAGAESWGQGREPGNQQGHSTGASSQRPSTHSQLSLGSWTISSMNERELLYSNSQKREKTSGCQKLREAALGLAVRGVLYLILLDE